MIRVNQKVEINKVLHSDIIGFICMESLMKSFDELNVGMEAIQQQMVEAKKNELANAVKEVRHLCKEFGFTAGMLKGSLVEGRKKQ